MKHTLFTLFTFFLIVNASFSQSSNKITGSVKATDGKALPYANVVILSSNDSSLVTGATTKEDGSYLFENIKHGSYIFVSSMVGYQKVYSPIISITAATTTLKVEPFILAEEAKDLTGVEIVAKKPLFEQQIDRLVVNVENSITAVGGSALDILSRSPGILVNKQSNSISMSGKQGVIIMINGKVSQLPIESVIQMLQGMDASNIEKIELITNPPARYDAQGNGGIINIVLKKNQDYGTNGAFSLTAGYGFRSKSNGSFNINHRREKVNLFADYSVVNNRLWEVMTSTRTIYNDDEILASTKIKSNREASTLINNLRTGVEYTISKKTNVTAVLSGFDSRWEMDAKNSSVIKDKLSETRIALKDYEINHWKNFNSSLNFSHTFSETKDLSVDVDYLYYHDNNPHDYINRYDSVTQGTVMEELIDIKKTTPINIFVAKADYTYKMGKNSKLELGAKSSISRMSNDVKVERNVGEGWINDPLFTQDYALLDDVGALYASFSTKFKEKTSIQVGLRGEYSHMNLTAPDSTLFDRVYKNIFPTFYISRELDKNNTLQFAYGRRINRPSFTDIAPFVVFMDPTTYFSGNPNLKPTVTDGMHLTYKFKEAYLFTLNYDYSRDPINGFQVQVNPETNTSTISSTNIDNSQFYYITASIPVSIKNWWKMTNNFTGFYATNSYKTDGATVNNQQLTGYVNTTQSFLFPKDFSAEINYFYVTPYRFGRAKTANYSELSLGVQKKLTGNKGTISLNVSDVFWTGKGRYSFKEKNSLATAGYISEPRVVKLTYSRSFGNSNLKGAKQRSNSSDDERGRVKVN